MEILALAKLAQQFATGGPHFDLAATISDIPRKIGVEYCPFCLGRHGIKSIMFAVEVPIGNLYDDGLITLL